MACCLVSAKPFFILTNAGILLSWPSGTNFSEMSEINTFLFKKMHSTMSSAKWQPFCHGLNVLWGTLDTHEWMNQIRGCLGSNAWYILQTNLTIGKTPVRIILWCPITKMVIKACFLIQPLEQEGGCQKWCISLCSKVFINHFYQMKASPECLNILIYRSRYWVDRLRRTPRRKI